MERSDEQCVLLRGVGNIFFGGVVGQPVDVPAGTVTTIDHHSLCAAHMVKMRGSNVGDAAGSPLHTVTTKDRFGLVTISIGGTPYVLADIGMRMLTPRELARAQGFPDWYVLERTADGAPITKTAQVRGIGNSVYTDKTVSRVRIPPSPPLEFNQLETVDFFFFGMSFIPADTFQGYI